MSAPGETLELTCAIVDGKMGRGWQRHPRNRQEHEVWMEQWFLEHSGAHHWAHCYVVECLIGRAPKDPNVLVQLVVSAIDAPSLDLERWLKGESFVRMHPCEAVATRRMRGMPPLRFIETASRYAVQEVLRDGDRKRWTRKLAEAIA